MSEDRALPHPVGVPVLLDAPGVRVVPKCGICEVVVDLSDPDHHVCIPVDGGEPRKVTVSVAAAEEEATREQRVAEAEVEAERRR